jgi:hypothetical protein
VAGKAIECGHEKDQQKINLAEADFFAKADPSDNVVKIAELKSTFFKFCGGFIISFQSLHLKSAKSTMAGNMGWLRHVLTVLSVIIFVSTS